MKMDFLKIATIALLGGFWVGCSDFFEVNPDDILLEKDYPGTITELYSGYMGIAAKVQDVADHAFFLEGIRSDFLEPTENATKDIVDLYNYREEKDNEFANPAGYYAVILNANDYIYHVEKFVISNPTAIDETTFRALVGGAIRYKAWAYSMLAKLYGEAVWIDEPLKEFKDLSGFPVYGFDDLVQKCIALIEDGITVGNKTVNGKGLIRWSNILFPGQGDSPANLEWNHICPDPEPLLAELYLFAGDYHQVIENCLSIVRRGGLEESYQLNKSDWGGNWIRMFREFRRMEHMFIVPYDYDRKQTNRLIEYYSNAAPNKYLLRPTQASMDRFASQVRQDGNLGDNTRGLTKTYRMQNGQWIVNKFSTGHETVDRIYRNDVLITLIRAADIYLWLSEALVQLGRFEEASVFINGGIRVYYNNTIGAFIAPFQSYPVTLYEASHRTRGNESNQGLRGRAILAAVGKEYLDKFTDNTLEDRRAVDELLVEETILESSGEARSLFAMMRMAKRWNDPSILADRVSAKFPEGQREAMRDHLMNPENWFIKYDLNLSSK